MTRNGMPRRAAIALAAAWTLSALLPPAAAPHAVLVKAVPASRAALAHPPARVQLWFNERLEPAYSVISVWDAGGNQVDTREILVGPEDAKLLSVKLPTLEPGRYTVRFRVLSVDGHIVESSYPFSVKPGAGSK